MYRDNEIHCESDNSRALETITRYSGIDNLRTMDVDEFGYCSKCLDVAYVIEATSANEKSVLMTRKLAKQLGATAIYVWHEWEDVDHEHPIYIEVWEADGTHWALKQSSWEKLHNLQRYIMNKHEENTHCSKKKAPFWKAMFPGVWVTKKELSAAKKNALVA